MPGSLRGKILVGFSLLAGTVVASLLITFLETALIEEQIEAQKQSHSLLNAAYEMRRQEKNYLLYSQRADLDHLRSAIGEFSEALERSGSHESLVPGVGILRSLIEDYRAAVNQLSPSMGGPNGERARTALREKGYEIVEEARAVSRKVENQIAAKLSRLKLWLVASKGLLAVLAVATVFAIVTPMMRSLREFRDKMDGITRGALREVPLTARDEEIASLERACNRMLNEISLRQASLVQSEKLASVGTMLAGIAHELNNPLSNISASCQILLEEAKGVGTASFQGPETSRGCEGSDPHGAVDAPGKEQRFTADEALVREMLLQIHGETERARITIRTLLDYSRTRPSEKTLFPLLPLIRETLVLFQGRFGKNVTVTAHIPAEVMIFGDRHRVQQVFVNLIKNALDSMEGAGSVVIEVVERAQEENGGGDTVLTPRPLLAAEGGRSVDIAVSDTGRGIPRTHLTRIFDPFFTTKDVGHGTGLGLFIVREIIDEHGGGIIVRSEEGRGTTFVLRLPTREVPAQCAF